MRGIIKINTGDSVNNNKISHKLKCNPKFGSHPDLFGGDSDYIVSIDDISREELLTLKKSNFSNMELKSIEVVDRDLFDAILDNSPEDVTAVVNYITAEVSKEIKNRTNPEKLIAILKENIDNAAESGAYNIAIKSRNVSARNIEEIESRLKNHNMWTIKVEPIGSREKSDWSYPLNEEEFEVVIDVREFMLSDKELDKIHFDMDKVIAKATGAEDITMIPCNSSGKKLARGYDGFFLAKVYSPSILAAYADLEEKSSICGNIAKFFAAALDNH